MSTVRVGSRGSKLALCQTRQVINRLEEIDSSLSFEVVIVKTVGDRVTNVPLEAVGGSGIFVKEIEQALIEDRIDIAVHSAKDLPARISDGLRIAAYPERQSPFDVLISKKGRLTDLLPRCIIGTGSARRRAQILNFCPDFDVRNLRGNLDTRIRKLDKGEYDAIVVAEAGLSRIGLQNLITEHLPYDIFVPSAGQGSLAIECRENDHIADVISPLDDWKTRVCVTAERSFLLALDAGCKAPVAAYAHIDRDKVKINAGVWALDGSAVFKRSGVSSIDESENLGINVGMELLNSPAKEILDCIRLRDER